MRTLLSICLLFSIAQPVSMGYRETQVGHTHDILKVKFNQDGTKLISYSAGDGWLCLWDVKSGNQLWRSKTEFIQKGDEYYTLTSFAFSSDDSLIVSGSGNGTVQLWDAKIGKILWRSDAHKDSVTAVQFSPDDKTIISAASPKDGENEIKALDARTGDVLKTLEGKPCTIISMSFEDNGKLLKTGNLDAHVSEWNLETGKQINPDSGLPCRMRRTYEWEVSFSSDLKTTAIRTGDKELTIKTTKTGAVEKTLEAEAYRVYSRLSADGKKVIVSSNRGFTFYNLATGEALKIPELSGTGSTIDLSQDGSLFAEGGGWGNAAIKITDTKSGTSHLIDGRLNGGQVPPYQRSELEVRLNNERKLRQAALREAKANRDRQAATDTALYRKQVYITFEHYGDMIDPGQLRIMESSEPNKSNIKKNLQDSNAVWLRIHNDSPLPIEVPTQSMYFPNDKCFYQISNGKKIFGLCDNKEISIWHGLENKDGKPIPYGFDFGSSAILLPKTSVLFAIPKQILRDGNAIRFTFTFQKEDDQNKIEKYGEERLLRFSESDLQKATISK
ncbi:MAG TPA: PQQ-binding-like beta-propeller repeat protein [Blastocatellia bacterium]|nr:PQQ-binding-like beta-propeller repeat protein [Blastocatellia bacterium]